MMIHSVCGGQLEWLVGDDGDDDGGVEWLMVNATTIYCLYALFHLCFFFLEWIPLVGIYTFN